MDKHLQEFIRISVFRMCEHYLPKLKIALAGVDKTTLWNHEKETMNSIGGIVLHIGRHLERHIIRYSAAGQVEGGIESYFPDEVNLSAEDLIQYMIDRFYAWQNVMNEYLAGDRKEGNLDMFEIYHLVEHTCYHLGQIIDRLQRITGKQFRFVQNGINEKALKALVYG